MFAITTRRCERGQHKLRPRRPLARGPFVGCRRGSGTGKRNPTMLTPLLPNQRVGGRRQHGRRRSCSGQPELYRFVQLLLVPPSPRCHNFPIFGNVEVNLKFGFFAPCRTCVNVSRQDRGYTRRASGAQRTLEFLDRYSRHPLDIPRTPTTSIRAY